jgi:hypothetical protein
VQEDWEGAVGMQVGSKGVEEGFTDIEESSRGPQDQCCSSYNQNKPLIDFSRFLTYKTYR